jgi:hypothetical protein
MSFLGFGKKKAPKNEGAENGSGPVEIEWMRAKPSMAQVYSQGLEYCFLSRDWKQCCPFVYCKDFLQDAILACHYGKTVNIYGFDYNPAACEPLYMDRTRIAVANAADKTFADKIPAVVDFMNQIEQKLKMVRTHARSCSNPQKAYSNGVFIIDSSNRWMLSPPMLSMYSLLLRVGFCHVKGEDFADTVKKVVDGKVSPYQKNDRSQLASAQQGIEKILKYGYARIFHKDPKKNYPDVNTSTMHYSTGIVSFSTGISKSVVPHWHRDLEKADEKKKKKAEQATGQTAA